ncbi:TPA: YkvA family protein [Legionella pneumophila]
MNKIKQFAETMKLQLRTLNEVRLDPRTPWLAKFIILIVVAYAISPIDLIPDFIPILGYIDDLILLPLGIYLAIKLVPKEVWQDCKIRTQDGETPLPSNYYVTAIIIGCWLVIILGIIHWIIK